MNNTTILRLTPNKSLLRSQASVAAIVAALGITAASPALAQAADSAAATETVVVTGSRVATGFQAPTPVTVVSSDQLQLAAPSSISDALNQLPQFRGSAQAQTAGVGTTGTVGQSFLNLRNLGTDRTLVLVDGHRVVPTGPTGVFDISLLPEGMIERTDVVTGGASAAYGSDAVAGVVNFVLDKKFTGFKTDIQGGMDQLGLAENVKVEATMGADFFGGKMHLLMSGEYYKNGGIKNYSEEPWYHACGLISNPTNSPLDIEACNIHSAQFTGGGMISTGPLKGTQFGPGGTPSVFTYGTDLTTSTMVGGSGAGAGPFKDPDVGAYFPVLDAVQRPNAYTELDYTVNDNISLFTTVLLAQSQTSTASTAPWEGTTSGYTLYNDNAYLPGSIKTAMAADGITSFVLNRYDYDFGLLKVNTENQTVEATVGANLAFGSWSGTVYYEHGENKFWEDTLNNPIATNEYEAADAVTNGNGQIVCRSSLTNPTNGCVPIDLFGYGSPSNDALAFVTGTSYQRLAVQQDVAEASASGPIIDLWAGTVTGAIGAGYRRESSVQTVDPISNSIKEPAPGSLGFPSSLVGQLGGFDRGNPQPISGSYNVKEVFGEAEVPLAKDMPFAHTLDANLAIRYTDYSISGSVESWKVGLTYEPLDDGQLRFRAARSHDIRAPNVSELFLNGTQGQGNLVDDFQSVSSPNRNPVVYTRSFGNANLTPEIADTWTAGVIYSPDWLDGFSGSIDYYHINVGDAITTLTGQQTIDQCYAGATVLCGQLVRDANGVLIAVNTPYVNAQSIKTDGFDLEANYRTSVLDHDLSFRWITNYVDNLATQNAGAARLQQAGNIGNPKWASVFDVTYTWDPLQLFVQERYLGSTMLNNTYPATTLAPSLNHVDDVFYTDATLNYTMLNNVQLFFTINNLFDKDPPRAPTTYFVFGTSGGGTNTMYDLIGRDFTLGIKVNL